MAQSNPEGILVMGHATVDNMLLLPSGKPKQRRKNLFSTSHALGFNDTLSFAIALAPPKLHDFFTFTCYVGAASKLSVFIVPFFVSKSCPHLSMDFLGLTINLASKFPHNPLLQEHLSGLTELALSSVLHIIFTPNVISTNGIDIPSDKPSPNPQGSR